MKCGMVLYMHRFYEKKEGERLLKDAILDYCARKGDCAGLSDNGALTIARGSHGKPYLPDRTDIHFSVSHSGGCWACVVGSSPVGIDIEVFDQRAKGRPYSTIEYKRYMKIAERFFTAEEMEYADRSGFEGFLSIWVRKEAYAKMLGTGIAEGFRTFSTVSGGEPAKRIGMAEFVDMPPAAGLIGAICVEEPSVIDAFVSMEEINGR